MLCLHSKLNELRMGGGAFDCELLPFRIQNAMVRILMKTIVDIKKIMWVVSQNNFLGGTLAQFC